MYEKVPELADHIRLGDGMGEVLWFAKAVRQFFMMHGRRTFIVTEGRFLLNESQALVEVHVVVPLSDPDSDLFRERRDERFP